MTDTEWVARTGGAANDASPHMKKGARRNILGAAFLAMIALAFACQSAETLYEARQRSASLEAAENLAALASLAIDELQIERSHAGAVAMGLSGARERYVESSQRLDETLALFEAEMSEARSTLNPTRSALEGMDRARENRALIPRVRENVLSAEYGVYDTAAAYSALSSIFRMNVTRLVAGLEPELVEFTFAYTALAGVQDRLALEMGYGMAAYAAGEISQSQHRAFMAAIAEKNVYRRQFLSLVTGEWHSAMLAIDGAEARAQLEPLRADIIRAGLGEPLDVSGRQAWRELTTEQFQELSLLRSRYVRDQLIALRATMAARTREAGGVFATSLALLAGSLFALFASVGSSRRKREASGLVSAQLAV